VAILHCREEAGRFVGKLQRGAGPAVARIGSLPEALLADETKAVSDMAKRPLRRVSATMIAISNRRLIILGSVRSHSAPYRNLREK
jgi:hypothetical protein